MTVGTFNHSVSVISLASFVPMELG